MKFEFTKTAEALIKEALSPTLVTRAINDALIKGQRANAVIARANAAVSSLARLGSSATKDMHLSNILNKNKSLLKKRQGQHRKFTDYQDAASAKKQDRNELKSIDAFINANK